MSKPITSDYRNKEVKEILEFLLTSNAAQKQYFIEQAAQGVVALIEKAREDLFVDWNSPRFFADNVTPDKVKQFIKQTLDDALARQRDSIKSLKQDDRPEITEWIVMSKEETKGYNRAIDDVLNSLQGGTDE